MWFSRQHHVRLVLPKNPNPYTDKSVQIINTGYTRPEQSQYDPRTKFMVEQIRPSGQFGIEHQLGDLLLNFDHYDLVVRRSSLLKHKFDPASFAVLRDAAAAESDLQEQEHRGFEEIAKAFDSLGKYDADTYRILMRDAFDCLLGRKRSRYEKILSQMSETDMEGLNFVYLKGVSVQLVKETSSSLHVKTSIKTMVKRHRQITTVYSLVDGRPTVETAATYDFW
jgi:hypothetical protein